MSTWKARPSARAPNPWPITRLGYDVIGMTNLGEAKCAREAEIAYATMAMITDYDCWKVDEAHVTVEMVIANLMKNAGQAKAIIKRVHPANPGRAELALSRRAQERHHDRQKISGRRKRKRS